LVFLNSLTSKPKCEQAHNLPVFSLQTFVPSRAALLEYSTIAYQYNMPREGAEYPTITQRLFLL